MRTRAEVVERIKSCLKLARVETNSNEHERSAAASAAENLIRRYKVTEAELGMVNPDVEEPSVEDNMSAVLNTLLKRGVRIQRGWNRDV